MTAEDNNDLLGAFMAIMDLALFTYEKPTRVALSIRQEIQINERFKLAPKGDFPTFSTLDTNTFQLLRYADPEITEQFIVEAMIYNLPNIAPFDKIQRDVLSPHHVNPAVDAAKDDLDQLILLITDELYVHTSLKPRNQDQRQGVPSFSTLPTSFPPGPTPTELENRAMIMALSSRFDSMKARPKQPLDIEQSVAIPCNSFALGKCKYKDACKFNHSTTAQPDVRISGGKFLPQFQKAIEDGLSAARNARKQSGRQATVMSLTSNSNASLSTELARAEADNAYLRAQLASASSVSY